MHYWSAAAIDDNEFEPNDEVDEVAWLPVDEGPRQTQLSA